ncbi:PPOX class probable F420-dependent enzyme [Actinacidiphila paucisporea]|uniref:PPOX class probable F420-dependent enzyme n=1 Tax=Actinacidiphila paucisporea TaxID=310782 RepID=A0A1M7QFK6_9ACTN|nr:PPOX class probable F420-dependent enzyme [Actinacidiphila paucisporea]
MPVPLDAATRALFDGRNFPVVSTLRADGSPQTSVVWIKRDGDTLLFIAPAGRGKTANVARDPRVSVTVFDAQNPYRSVELRGTAHLTDDDVKLLSDELSVKYIGETHEQTDGVVRVVVRVVPDTVIAFPRQ